MTLATVRDGLKTRLATVSGLRVHDVWPDTVNPPAAIVRPVSGRAHVTFSGHGSFSFEVIAVVELGTLRTAQDALDSYLDLTGATSLIAAIEGDQTLGGAAELLLVSGWRDYDTVAINGVQYLAATLDLEVWT